MLGKKKFSTMSVTCNGDEDLTNHVNSYTVPKLISYKENHPLSTTPTPIHLRPTLFQHHRSWSAIPSEHRKHLQCPRGSAGLYNSPAPTWRLTPDTAALDAKTQRLIRTRRCSIHVPGAHATSQNLNSFRFTLPAIPAEFQHDKDKPVWPDRKIATFF